MTSCAPEGWTDMEGYDCDAYSKRYKTETVRNGWKTEAVKDAPKELWCELAVKLDYYFITAGMEGYHGGYCKQCGCVEKGKTNLTFIFPEGNILNITHIFRHKIYHLHFAKNRKILPVVFEY